VDYYCNYSHKQFFSCKTGGVTGDGGDGARVTLAALHSNNDPAYFINLGIVFYIHSHSYSAHLP
jgi:hypothetical protein